MKYKVVQVKQGWMVKKGMFGVYWDYIGPFPSEGDAQSWINVSGSDG